MKDHPEGKEHLPKKRSPRFIPFIQRVRKSSNHSNHVENQKGGWRDQNCGPLENVELTKLRIVRWFCSHCEVGVKSSNHFEKPLENGKEMSRNASNHPKLLVTPPIFNADTTPPQLEHAGNNDGDEEAKKPYAC